MNDSHDGIWPIIGLAAAAALFDISLWGASHFIAEFGSSVVIPTFRFADLFIRENTRGLAEVFGMIVMTGIGMGFHSKTMDSLAKEFSASIRTIVGQIDKLEGALAIETRISSRAMLSEEKIKGETSELKLKADSLKKENEGLVAELFILKNPEKVAEDKKHQEQKQNEEKLKAFASNVTWGSM